MFRRMVAGSICAAALLSAIGCGSSSDEEALTKAQYVKRANAICKRAVTDKDSGVIRALERMEDTEKAVTPEMQEDLVSEVALPPLRLMVEQFEDLSAPDGQEDEVEAIIEAYESAVAEFEADPTLALGSSSRQPFVKPDELAVAYGMSQCQWV